MWVTTCVVADVIVPHKICTQMVDEQSVNPNMLFLDAKSKSIAIKFYYFKLDISVHFSRSDIFVHAMVDFFIRQYFHFVGNSEQMLILVFASMKQNEAYIR